MNTHNNAYILGGALALALGLALCAGAESVVIKEEAYVKGPKILLSDIASLPGDKAAEWGSLEVTAAPAPGVEKNVSASLVEARLREAGVNVQELSFEGSRTVKTTTMALDVTKEMLTESLRAFILAQMPWDPQDAEIDIPPPLSDLVVPDGELSILWSASPQYRYIGPGAFRATVEVDRKSQQTLVLRAEVHPYAEVLVTATDIARGKLLTEKDLELRKIALTDAPSGVILDPSAIVGQLARRTIFAGTVLTSRDVEQRIVVQRNQIVPVEMYSGAVHVSTQARALGDARTGDTVVCANLNSKEQFQGVARGDGVVEVR